MLARVHLPPTVESTRPLAEPGLWPRGRTSAANADESTWSPWFEPKPPKGEALITLVAACGLRRGAPNAGGTTSLRTTRLRVRVPPGPVNDVGPVAQTVEHEVSPKPCRRASLSTGDERTRWQRGPGECRRNYIGSVGRGSESRPCRASARRGSSVGRATEVFLQNLVAGASSVVDRPVAVL
jgi:hypothetical protein